MTNKAQDAVRLEAEQRQDRMLGLLEAIEHRPTEGGRGTAFVVPTAEGLRTLAALMDAMGAPIKVEVRIPDVELFAAERYVAELEGK